MWRPPHPGCFKEAPTIKRLALMTVLLAGAGFSALTLGGCSGPTPPPGDAGFFPPAPDWATGGSTGTAGGTGGVSGTGGSFGGGNPGTRHEDGGRQEGTRR